MMTRSLFAFALLLLGSTLPACAPEKSDAAPDTTRTAIAPGGAPYAYDRIRLDTTRAPGTSIDSTFPKPEQLRRFRAGLDEPSGLVGGASSRDALVRDFVTALAAGDRQALGRLTLSRAEFAYLYYPASRDARMTNGLPPTLRWDLLTLNSEKGIGRALDRMGRKPMRLGGINCSGAPVTMGAVRQQDGCTVQLTLADSSVFTGRLFGSIIEYRGRFKFVGYSNDM